MTATRPATGGIPLPLPRLTSFRATVKVPTAQARFRVHEVSWLPALGWGCTCDQHLARRPCDHVTLTLATLRSAP